MQVNALLAPGTSLATSNAIGERWNVACWKSIRSNRSFVVRVEPNLDEHAEGVNVSELVLEVTDGADREETIEEIRQAMEEIPGVVSSTEQPLAHLISHMISGVKAQIGIKLYGDDLDVLRQTAQRMETAIADVPGLTDIV